MVSPLTSRLFNIQPRTEDGIRLPLATNRNGKWHRSRRNEKISGYIADRDSPLSPAISACKQIRAYEVGQYAKKRKIEELNYQAANLKNDIEKAGNISLDIISRSQVLPIGSVDMSCVELILVSKESPYVYEPSDHIKTAQPIDVNCSHEDLIRTTQPFYRPLHNNLQDSLNYSFANFGRRSTSSASCTSSSSNDTRSVTFSSPIEETARSSSINIPKLSQFCASHYLTLEQVLAPLISARLITQVNHPYRIVHANAAFSRLTGISSDNLVGNSVSSLLRISNLPKLAFSFQSIKNIALYVFPEDNGKKNDSILSKSSFKSYVNCQLLVSPVCADLKHTNARHKSDNYNSVNVTHFSLDIEKCSESFLPTKEEIKDDDTTCFVTDRKHLTVTG